jgi:hypothetical protein
MKLMVVFGMLRAAGARGVVKAAGSGKPVPATIVVEGIRRNTSADRQFGYYNRCAQLQKYGPIFAVAAELCGRRALRVPSTRSPCRCSPARSASSCQLTCV